MFNHLQRNINHWFFSLIIHFKLNVNDWSVCRVRLIDWYLCFLCLSMSFGRWYVVLISLTGFVCVFAWTVLARLNLVFLCLVHLIEEMIKRKSKTRRSQMSSIWNRFGFCWICQSLIDYLSSLNDFYKRHDFLDRTFTDVEKAFRTKTHRSMEDFLSLFW